MENQFNTDISFQAKMRPAARRIYDLVFPGCCIKDLRENGVKVHILDKEFGIDSLVEFPSMQWISLQEKYRRHDCLVNLKLRIDPNCPDFTQEYMNAEGTQYEAKGEWFKLGAQLYFYGWANESETGFEKWFIMDIAKYKLLVEQSGGLEKMGRKKNNRIHGRASFFAIPMDKLRQTFITESEAPHDNP